MGKPRLIILVRHAQSEGNKNRDIHQYIPDHRVKLTAEGWLQAEDAGRRLKAMLRKEDTIRIFTSPYRRTRETTEGILRTLTEDHEESGPSPFQRDDIKVYEEPRLREQDFGNFQPCSHEMNRMWQERADYGHFFYRIPNGESAADAYDRISGFNESLWRQFGYDDFPSVCVLVTHGLMGRVFLMRWYKYTVEYFEDLRNLHHCEFLVMDKNQDDSYDLKTTLRTWSELEARKSGPPSPKLPPRRWGGCLDGCNHEKTNFTNRVQRTSTVDLFKSSQKSVINLPVKDKTDSPIEEPPMKSPLRQRSTMTFNAQNLLHEYEKSTIEEHDGQILKVEASSSEDEDLSDMLALPQRHRKASLAIRVGRDGGGSHSGMPSPQDFDPEDDDHPFSSSDKGHVRVGSFRSDQPLSIVHEESTESKQKEKDLTKPNEKLIGEQAGHESPMEQEDEQEGTPEGDIY